MTAVAIAVAVALVAVAAILRAAGASLVRTPRVDALRDAAEGDSRAAVVAELLEDRTRIQPALSTVLTSLVVLAVVPAGWALDRLLEGPALAMGLVATVGVIVAATDPVARVVGRRRPRKLAYRFARFLAVAVRLGDAANDLVEFEEEEPIDASAPAEEEERELIRSVLEFTDTIVREVMVPRTDMVTVPTTSTIEETLDVVLSSGKSRVPVVGEGPDDVVGVVYARDLLQMLRRGARSDSVKDLARAPYFVPETKPISELLREMQANRVHMAIVVDEFGGTAGLVTIEDLLEEIVGEIVDEYDREEPMILPLEDGSYLVDARLDVATLADTVGVELPAGEWDTVGGLVLGLAGRVPREGESVEYDGLVLTAQRVQGRRIARVRVAWR